MFFLSFCIEKGLFQYIVKLYLFSSSCWINDDISYFTLGSLEFCFTAIFFVIVS